MDAAEEDELSQLQAQWERLAREAGEETLQESQQQQVEHPRLERAAPQTRLSTTGAFWTMSSTKPRGHARGFTVTCRLHMDVGDVSRGRCKRSLNLGVGPGELSEVEIKTRLKRWLLRGAELSLESRGATSRTDHAQVDARHDCGAGLEGHALDARLRAIEAELRQLDLLCQL